MERLRPPASAILPRAESIGIRCAAEYSSGEPASRSRGDGVPSQRSRAQTRTGAGARSQRTRRAAEGADSDALLWAQLIRPLAPPLLALSQHPRRPNQAPDFSRPVPPFSQWCSRDRRGRKATLAVSFPAYALAVKPFPTNAKSASSHARFQRKASERRLSSLPSYIYFFFSF